MLDVDVQTYLPGRPAGEDGYRDHVYSLEARSPLLDHELMEFAALPAASDQAPRGEKKIALRGALRGWVPDAILDAPKRGFRVPLADWLRGELREHAREVLLDSGSVGRGYFRTEYVRDMLDQHVRGDEDRSAGFGRCSCSSSGTVSRRPPGRARRRRRPVRWYRIGSTR